MPNTKTTNRKTAPASAKATEAKANVAAATEAKAEAEKPKPFIHENAARSYAGASPTFRGHGKQLSPVRLNVTPKAYSERDAAFLRDLCKIVPASGEFKRGDCDAGAVARLIGHGYVRHVSGDTATRDCVFAVTKAGRDRIAPVTAKPKA